MDAVFIDFETTGANQRKHQPIEFAAVPVIGSFIRRDLMYHTYIDHRHWVIDNDIFDMTIEKIKNRRKDVPSIMYHQLGKQFRNWLILHFPNITQDNPISLGGQNIGGFDIQFLFEADSTLKPSGMFYYNYVDLGNMYLTRDDHKVPSLNKVRERAIAEGAPLTYDNTHRADEDALLCAELFCWEMEGRIIYAEPNPNVPFTLKLDVRNKVA